MMFKGGKLRSQFRAQFSSGPSEGTDLMPGLGQPRSQVEDSAGFGQVFASAWLTSVSL